MNKEDFNKEIIGKLSKINVKINENEIEDLYDYTEKLLEWNTYMNLTAITDIDEIILKHYTDSLTINKYIEEGMQVIDIGTGAGFPGIPLKIMNKNNNFILVDSLNKRIKFLEEVKNTLNLKNIELIHSRVEDLARNSKYREKNDIVVSRAVANLSTLLEYMLPFIKENGLCICMKGPNIEQELEESKRALEILGGKIEKIENIILPDSDIERNIILVRKIKSTPSKYPRKAGIPAKQPIK